jgi:hypothetical protein
VIVENVAVWKEAVRPAPDDVQVLRLVAVDAVDEDRGDAQRYGERRSDCDRDTLGIRNAQPSRKSALPSFKRFGDAPILRGREFGAV